MKKPIKVLRIILLVVLILVLVIVLAIDIFAESALKAGIETAATKVLNVGVSIEDIDLSIMAGRLGIGNLSINNPPGYQHDKLLQLKDAEIEVDVKSLLTDHVDVRQIKLDGLNLVLEQRGITGNNLQDIIKTISGRAKDKEQPQGSGKKLHIANLEISDVTVNAKLLPIPGRADTIVLKLSPIRMTDLGGDDKLDTADLSGKILLAIADGVAEQGGELLPTEIISPMKDQLKEFEKLPTTLLGEGEKILREGKDLGKEVTEGLKELLAPRKKE